MLEIELKAWASDLEAVRARLEELGKTPKRRPVVKEDVYYCAPDVDPRTADPLRDRIIRLRKDEGEATLTAKRKRIEYGVETNDEIEVAVGDAAAAERLIDYLGYRPFVKKRKETRAYEWSKGVVVELNRIEGLGDFVEVEALAEDGASPAEVEEKRAAVRAVLGALGIAAERIEPRPYMDLLRSRAVRA